ncbi:MAG: family 20 glycosylhydrolase [Bacteroidaceae bacterium]|nr:family 20 glycosylhydrolase [Bacteroidaceae bacterium]
MRRIITTAFVALVICLPYTLQAGVEHLLPKVQMIEDTGKEPFVLGCPVKVVYSGGAAQCPLLEEILVDNGCALAQKGATVKIRLVKSIKGAYDYELYGYENEAYTLKVSADKILIEAVTNTGVIRAAQTLAQLAEGCEKGYEAIPAVKITDWPAFKLRGYMHDTGRSYIPVDELIKQIELLSRFKVNTFHWHLTENQAWRFEVKAYPELTSVTSMTRHEGEYYTQEECRAVMEAAKKHGVIVIPEIDMPGHSDAFERAMGFGMQTEEGKKVLKAALDEVVEVFADAPYIHIGGDEVSTTAAYLNEMIAHVESKGKKAGIWNPINGIGQDALDASLAQMWGTRGIVAPGKANIDCRYNYTNHFDVFADLVGIYKSTIYYKERGDATVAGTISACWNDRKLESVADIMAQNNVYANIIASAERAWIGGGKHYIDNCNNGGTNGGGGVMLPNSGDEYEAFVDWERRFLFHKAHSLKDESIPYVKQTNVRWRITEAFPNEGDVSKVFPPEELMNKADILPENYQYGGKTYHTGVATGAGIYLRHTWGNGIISAYYDTPLYNQTAYAWTYVYSPKEQEAGAIIEFQNYSRSEQDPAPAAGQWDLYGSNIWLNGAPIPAPSYENTGLNISNKEVTLKNENFAARKPIAVQLQKGWNKVFLKLPYVNAPYRLDKWMFTFVLTDKEGREALDGLIYSPDQQMGEANLGKAPDVSSEKCGQKPNERHTLYHTPDSNGFPYRIPAIAVAPNGDIFAISDNRPCGMDIGYGEVDIKCRISTDNGYSWGDEFFVADGQGGSTNAMTTGFGDAAIVADRKKNRLLVMMVCGRTVCWNGRWTPEKSLTDDAVNRVARLYATYDKAHKKWVWSQPEEVTNSIYNLFLDENGNPTVSSLFIGSGKICQSRVVKKGRYYRLYCSMWTRDEGNRVIYSDDFGGSWQVLGKVADRPAPYGDEPKIEELPDGTVVLSSRKGAGRYFNLFTFADNTYTTGTWGAAVSSNDVPNGLSFGRNSTNGEILLVNAVRKSDGGKCDLMLQSVPTGDGRSNVSIFYKEMKYNADGSNAYTPTTFAQGWTLGLQVSDRGSAYSTMTMQKDGRVAFLYEEEPGGYNIVYAPLSIEEVTGGRYVVDDKK